MPLALVLVRRIQFPVVGSAQRIQALVDQVQFGARKKRKHAEYTRAERLGHCVGHWVRQLLVDVVDEQDVGMAAHGLFVDVGLGREQVGVAGQRLGLRVAEGHQKARERRRGGLFARHARHQPRDGAHNQMVPARETEAVEQNHIRHEVDGGDVERGVGGGHCA